MYEQVMKRASSSARLSIKTVKVSRVKHSQTERKGGGNEDMENRRRFDRIFQIT